MLGALRYLVVCSALVLASAPAGARACGPCGSGDPAITFGALDRPVRDRVRVAASLRSGAVHVGGVDVIERRVAASLAWSPEDTISLGLSVPVAARDVTYPNLGRDQSFGLSDVALSGRIVLARDRAFAPEHVLALSTQLTLPTTIPLRDATGALLPTEAQPGRGALEPALALSWSWHGAGLGSLVSIAIAAPFEGIGAERGGAAMRASALGWWQPAHEVSIIAGLEARAEADATRRGTVLAHAPGASLDLVLGLALRPAGPWTLVAVVRAPLRSAHRGDLWESPALELSVSFDA